jgi:hypothetical protein
MRRQKRSRQNYLEAQNIPSTNRLRKNSLDEGDGLPRHSEHQPVRLNAKMNRLQPRRVLLRTEKQCPQGLNRLRKSTLYEGHGFSRAANAMLATRLLMG